MVWTAKSSLRLTILAVFAATAPGIAVAGPAIDWRIENPFRFFADPADTEVHRATYLALSPEERRAPVLAAERALGLRHTDGWAATMYAKTCWKGNRFVCPDGGDYINPQSHRIIAEVVGIDDAAEVDCTWLTAPQGGSVLRGTAVTQLCSEPAKFDIPYPAGAIIQLKVGGISVAETTARVEDLLIVGMGDSFASGEGNPDVPVRFSRERAANYGRDLSGYPARIGSWRQIGDKRFINENARWLDQACHRSLYSYQTRAALQLAVEDPHRAVTFVGVACSGAEITWGLFLRYKGNEWVPDPPILSQISAAAEAQCGENEAPMQDLPEAYHIKGMIPELRGGLVLRKCTVERARKIDLVFLSIGGNDIGFSRLLANAVLADQSLLRKLGGWIGEVHGLSEATTQLAQLDSRYKSLNRALHNILYVPWEESDRVVLTAYPGMALLGDGSAMCPDGAAGMEVLPDFKLSEQKARIGTWTGDKLHQAMVKGAEDHGWTFADSHRAAFIGRGICAGFSDNAFSVADDLRLPRKVDGAWQPYNPADYRAYVSRQRWFRTPNDAFMTGNFHVHSSMLQKVLKFNTFSWFQVLLASTYSGAFHPTAEGYAAMADATVDKARRVIEKYERRSDRIVTPSERPEPASVDRSLE